MVCGKVDAEINVCCVLTPSVLSQRQGSSAVRPPVESTAPEAQEPDAEVEHGMRAPSVHRRIRRDLLSMMMREDKQKVSLDQSNTQRQPSRANCTVKHNLFPRDQ